MPERDLDKNSRLVKWPFPFANVSVLLIFQPALGYLPISLMVETSFYHRRRLIISILIFDWTLEKFNIIFFYFFVQSSVF